MGSSRTFTVPNLLTFLRIAAVPVFLWLLEHDGYKGAFMLFLAAGITDTIDGVVARLTDSRSELGTMLDPVADKLLLVTAFVVLGTRGLMPLWLVGLVIGRDLVILGGYLVIRFLHGESMPVEPTPVGKANVFFQLFTVGFVLLSLARPGLPLATTNLVFQVVTAATSAISCAQYVMQGIEWHRSKPAAA